MKRLHDLYYECLRNNQYLVTKEEKMIAANALAAAINWANSQTILMSKSSKEKLSQFIGS